MTKRKVRIKKDLPVRSQPVVAPSVPEAEAQDARDRLLGKIRAKREELDRRDEARRERASGATRSWLELVQEVRGGNQRCATCDDLGVSMQPLRTGGGERRFPMPCRATGCVAGAIQLMAGGAKRECSRLYEEAQGIPFDGVRYRNG